MGIPGARMLNPAKTLKTEWETDTAPTAWKKRMKSKKIKVKVKVKSGK